MNITNINGGYVCFDVFENDIRELLEFLKKYNFRGINVTVPYKEKIIKFLDELSDEAKLIGAVNTILFKSNGTIAGFNTDSYGFDKMMARNNVNPNGKKIMVLGSGGSTLTVLYTLKKYDYKNINLIARNTRKAEQLVYKLDLKNINIFDLEILNKNQEYDIIINTISLGLKGERFLNMSKVYCNNSIIDLQYKPKVTSFIKEFEYTKIKKINGLEMLIFQGYKAFQIWTDKKIQLNVNDVCKFIGVENAFN
jgi:shikimate dehydrogenase